MKTKQAIEIVEKLLKEAVFMPVYERQPLRHLITIAKRVEDVKPETLHQWYLEAVKKLKPESYNPNAQKPYSELTKEQKFIDEFIATALKRYLKDD